MARDITNPRLLYAKGLIFLITGMLAALLVLRERPTLKVALLLLVVVWCFSRAYYFAFYVVQHYVDPGYRFGGLTDFVRYVLRRRSSG